MVGTIGFAGSKARDRGRFLRWAFRLAIPHALMSLAAGATLGTLAAFVGSVVGLAGLRLPMGFVAAILITFAVADAFGLPAHYLGRARQVPLAWKEAFPAPMSAALYGATLGFGLASAVHFWSFWAVVLVLLVAADPGLGLFAGIAFGLGRVMPVILSALVPVQSIHLIYERLDGRKALLRQVSVLATAFAAWNLLRGWSSV